MLFVFAMKCCTKMPCPLCPITIIAAYFLHLYACLTCSSVHGMPHLFTHCLPTTIYVMLMSILHFFYFCYMQHFFVTPFCIVCVHIFVWLVFVLNLPTILYIHVSWSSCRKKRKKIQMVSQHDQGIKGLDTLANLPGVGEHLTFLGWFLLGTTVFIKLMRNKINSVGITLL